MHQDPAVHMFLISKHPGLAIEGYVPTSPTTPKYNCIAWSMNDEQNWWWPNGPHPEGSGREAHWPKTARAELTLKSFTMAFKSKGFKICTDGNRDFEPGFEKVAIYAQGTSPKHAARQIDGGNWTHKLGQHIDLTATLRSLEGDVYGRVVRIMKRRSPA